MNDFETPSNTTIPTIPKAIAEAMNAYKPYVPYLMDDKGLYLSHLYMLRQLVNRLWQGSVHLSSTSIRQKLPAGLKKYANELQKEWLALEEASYADAAVWGLDRETFMNPTMYGNRPYEGCDRKPKARTTMSRMLAEQFHAGDDPSIFLMRQLGMRIALAAYVKNISNTVQSEFFTAIRRMKIPRKWHNAPELKFAAKLYAEEKDVKHHRFGYIILREVLLMEDLFELVLRQMHTDLLYSA